MPVSAASSAVASGGRLMATPSASSTSAAPQAELAARLPCLTTWTPAAAATIAPMVEMFTVCAPSPPVPTRSTSGPGTLIGVARLSMTSDRPASSAAVSPFIRSATANPATWTGVAAPSMISFIAQAAWSELSVSPLISAPIRPRHDMVGCIAAPSPAPAGAVQAWAGSWPFACCRISPASAAANGTGSIGWLVTASAPDQVASQPSSARPMTSSTGGQL